MPRAMTTHRAMMAAKIRPAVTIMVVVRFDTMLLISAAIWF
jgi:hypothetical protein